MNFLISGCSFSGNGDCNDNRSHFWSEPLRTLGNVVNLSVPGAGNKFIADSVINETIKNTYDYVLVMWTGLKRLDIPVCPSICTDEFIPNLLVNESVYIDHAGSELDFPSSKLDKLRKEYFMLSSDATCAYESLMQFLRLQQHLESKNIKYFFTSYIQYFTDANVLPNSNFGLYKHKELNYLIEQLDISRWIFENKKTIFDIASETNSFADDGFHPSYQTSMAWGNIVKQKLEQDIGQQIKTA
jgi:hypothetical protein